MFSVTLGVALLMQLFSIVPTGQIMISDIMYFGRLDWEQHCLYHLPPGKYY